MSLVCYWSINANVILFYLKDSLQETTNYMLNQTYTQIYGYIDRDYSKIVDQQHDTFFLCQSLISPNRTAEMRNVALRRGVNVTSVCAVADIRTPYRRYKHVDRHPADSFSAFTPRRLLSIIQTTHPRTDSANDFICLEEQKRKRRERGKKNVPQCFIIPPSHFHHTYLVLSHSEEDQIIMARQCCLNNSQ